MEESRRNYVDRIRIQQHNKIGKCKNFYYLSLWVTRTHLSLQQVFWFIPTFLGASPVHSAQYVGKDQQPWLLQVGKALKGAQTWLCAVLDQYYSYFSIPGCFYSLSQYSQEMVCKVQQHLPLNFQDYRKCNCTKQIQN